MNRTIKKIFCLLMTFMLISVNVFYDVHGENDKELTMDEIMALSESERLAYTQIYESSLYNLNDIEGTADVYDINNVLLKSDMPVREAWKYVNNESDCSENSCTLKLTSDVSITKEFSTGGTLKTPHIIFDLNGHIVDCNKKCRFMNLFSNGDVKVMDSSADKTGVIRNGHSVSGGGCFRNMGILELDGITIENCESNELLTMGGAIEAWCITAGLKITDPHTYVYKCTIKNCSADTGGAIGTSISKLFGNANNSNDDDEDPETFTNVQIDKTRIVNCTALTSGGGIRVKGMILIENSSIENCTCSQKGGGIWIEDTSDLYMNNTDIIECKVTSKSCSGGGIYIEPGMGGEMHQIEGEAYIKGGTITGCVADNGGGIYKENGDIESTLKVGGNLKVFGNTTRSGKPSNVVLPGSTTLQFYEGGLTGDANVYVGGPKKKSVGKLENEEVAEATAKKMHADYIGSQYDDVDVIYKSGSRNVWLDLSQEMELISAKLTGTGRENVKAKIDYDKREITFTFGFQKSITMENYEIEWDGGTTGTIRTFGDAVGVQNHPYHNGIMTQRSYTSASDNIVLEHNGASQWWLITYINDGSDPTPPSPTTQKAAVRVIDGTIKEGTILYQYGNLKCYSLVIGESFKVIANEKTGQEFNKWEVSYPYGKQDELIFDEYAKDPTIMMIDTLPLLTATYNSSNTVYATNGTINDNTQVDCYVGQTVEAIADSLPGKTFSHWDVSGTTLSDEQKSSEILCFEVPDNDVYLTANYIDNKYNLSLSYAYINDDINLTSANYEAGTSIKISAYDAGGLVFDHWETVGLNLTEQESKEKTLIISMPDNDANVNAIYAKASVAPHGLTLTNAVPDDSDLDLNNIYAGSLISIKAAPSEGETFVCWQTSDNISISDKDKYNADLSFYMPDSDVEIEAICSSTPLLPKHIKAINGTINDTADTYLYEGTSLSLKPYEYENKTFDHWQATGLNLNEAQSRTALLDDLFMPDNDVEFEAIFVDSRYELDVLGAYIYDGENYYDNKIFAKGEEVTVMADESLVNGIDVSFERWLVVSGELTLTSEQETNSTISFIMPENDLVLVALFTKAITPNYVYIYNGTVNDAAYDAIYPGEEVEILSDTIQNKTFKYWYSSIELTEEDKIKKSLTFTMPDNDVYFYGVYEDNEVAPAETYTPPYTSVN